MFQLTKEEFENLISQIATSSSHGGRRKLPYVFTEQGIAMLSGVLNSDVAIDVNISIMRAFVQFRRMGLSIVDVKRKIDRIEKKYDKQFKIVFDAIRQLLNPPAQIAHKQKRKMGFTSPVKKNRTDQICMRNFSDTNNPRRSTTIECLRCRLSEL